MTGVALRVDLRGIEQVQARIDELAAVDRAQLLDDAGALVESQTRRRIADEKTGPDGQAWPAWSPGYAKTRHGGHSLLRAESGLLDSVQHLVTGDEVEIGSNLVYAATHQFGDPKRKIPARPYLGLSTDNAREVEQLLLNRIDEVLR